MFGKLLTKSLGSSVVVIVTLLLAAGDGSLNANDSTAAVQPAPAGPPQRGIVAHLGIDSEAATRLIEQARQNEVRYFLQVETQVQADNIREQARQAGLLGTRIFVSAGALTAIGLADNIANRVIVDPAVVDRVPRTEVLRILQPRGIAQRSGDSFTKPVPEGTDDWSHPYHGPDNNPQSNDQLVRGHFQTQFLEFPKFSPMPEQSVIAGGRIYKAMGHIAHKANQNAMLNTLLCIDAYNGTILWRRELPKGFMIHRNTMIATDDALYLGDDESCKVIDGRTGKVRAEIAVPKELADGPVWKWMAVRDGTLYALIGHEEIRVDTVRSNVRGLGHWPWGMWKGHDYKDPKVAFGFGRTFVAIDLESHSVLWQYRDEEFLDGRAICMNDDAIFAYAPEKFIAKISLEDGKLLWKNDDQDLLEAIGPNGRAQLYITGYATTSYMKTARGYLFFAGPQRKKLVAASADNGKLAWTFPTGNLQLVLRDDAVWAAGPQNTDSGFRLDYASGKILAKFPARRACTRATGCLDSIFFRASGGTVRVLTDSATAHHIAPMRPPCQDGVLIASGHLYWGPWMCGCQLSLYGNIALAPLGPPPTDAAKIYADARITGKNISQVEPLKIDANDWPTYRRDNTRQGITPVAIPQRVRKRWSADLHSSALPTAPVVAGGMVFVADRSGLVQAFDRAGKPVWQAYANGAIYYPPTVAGNRIFAGSADGRVWAWEAKTGRFLWSFRVAPSDRMIPVYGRLISRWPVAGGVAVHDGTVYAAAGITHYDGTYVVALDAVTGELKQANTTSGQLAAEVNDGISLQGKLVIVGNELRFLAGGVYEVARYDLATLQCLNRPRNQVNSQYRTAFYPYYPDYGKYVSVDYRLPDGRKLEHDASYEGSRFTDLALHEALPPGMRLPRKEAARWITRRGGKPPKTLWRDRNKRRFTSFIISTGNQRIVIAGHPEQDPGQQILACLDIDSGADVWSIETPGEIVKGGTAIDHQGRIYAVTKDGQLICYAK